MKGKRGGGGGGGGAATIFRCTLSYNYATYTLEGKVRGTALYLTIFLFTGMEWWQWRSVVKRGGGGGEKGERRGGERVGRRERGKAKLFFF